MKVSQNELNGIGSMNANVRHGDIIAAAAESLQVTVDSSATVIMIVM